MGFSEDKKNDDYYNNDNRSSVRDDRSTSFDALVVGGGIMGVCIARDLASSGYKVAIVERDASLGGVWIHNNYPGLRLQGVGTAWRCLSLAPDFHKQANNNNHDIIQNNNSKDHQTTTTKMNKKMKTESSFEPDSRLLYCPLASETLSYIQSMADHPNITVFTNTSYEGLVNVNKKKRDDNDDDNNGQQQQQQQHSAKLCSTTIDSTPNNTNTMNSIKNIFGGGGGGITTTQKEENKKKRVVKQVVSAQTIILAVGYTTHNSGKPWMPIDRTAVTNGATIIHSAELSGSAALLSFNNNKNNNTATTITTTSNNNHNHQQNSNAIGTTYVVGGQKAAVEVLKSLNPSTENNNNNNVLWALRRHGIFLKREVIDEALAVTTTNTDTDDAPTISWIMSRIVRLVPTLIYFGKFQMAESILMALGMGVRVGENANVDADANANEVPSFRGGIVRQEDIDHALKFKQTIITNVGINSKGAVVLKRNRNNNGDDSGGNDESSDMVVGPNDRIIFCTGQRTGQSTDDYMNMAVDHSKDGLFVALPYSSQACSAAAYTTKLVLDYLDGNSNSNSNGGGGDSLSNSNSKSTSNSTSNEYYSSGKFKASLEKLASHVRQVPGGGGGSSNSNNEWAKVVVMLSGVGLQFPNQILPSVRGDLAMSPHWTSSKVLGQNLDARATLKEFAKPDYGGLYTMATVGVTLLGFRFAKRRFLELPTFKK